MGKKIISLLVIFTVIGAILYVSYDNTENTEEVAKEVEVEETNKEDIEIDEDELVEESIDQDDVKEEEEVVLLEGKMDVVIDIENYGIIEIEIDANVAPVTVTNFVNLVESGFYNGLTFHRIIDGFMIQGGDPLGNGTGGSSEEILGEFELNGIENNLSHTRGVISMARSAMYDSASSQFFIVHEDATYLDGQYAAFGIVTSGMQIVDEICEKVPVIDGNGTVESGAAPIITSIEIIK